MDKSLLDLLTSLQQQGEQKKLRQIRKRYALFAATCLLFVGCSTAVSSIGYQILTSRYRQDLALAHVGANHLEAASISLRTIEHEPFNMQAIQHAQSNFSKALVIFTRLNNDVPDAVTELPIPHLRPSKLLIELAMTMAQAGVASCFILNTVVSKLLLFYPQKDQSDSYSHSVFDPIELKKADARIAKHFIGPQGQLNGVSGVGLTDMALLRQNLQLVHILLRQASFYVQQLQAADIQFSPQSGRIVNEIREKLPFLMQGLQQAEAYMTIAPFVLGITEPANYLVEVLDSSELRPGGGFVGNYGIVTLVGGRLVSAHVTDTYLLDKKLKNVPYPVAYSWFHLSNQWGLRDSNLDADFPTSARNALTLYTRAGGKQKLIGVIAITPVLIERILMLSGPITIPEYHEVITAQNLIDRIHYHQLIEEGQKGALSSADGFSSRRKHFTALLAEHFTHHILSLPGSQWPSLLQILVTSIQNKDVQLYFVPPEAERILQAYHLDAAIQSSTRDDLFVVNANITPNKANQYLTTSIRDQIVVSNSGIAIHRTQIKLTWDVRGQKEVKFYGPAAYRSYLRLYMPKSSTFLTTPDWQQQESGSAFGQAFWGGYVRTDYPMTKTITFTWRVTGAAQRKGSGWRYRYLLQHQAGDQQQMDVEITLPKCAVITQTSPDTQVKDKHIVYASRALVRDTVVGIDYKCG